MVVSALSFEEVVAIVIGLFFVLAFVTAIVTVIAVQMRKSRVIEMELVFKQELLERGLKVDEIERLLAAGQPSPAAMPNAASAGPADPQPPPVDVNIPLSQRRLVRLEHDRKIGGVVGGLAAYIGIDPTLLRVATVLAAFFTGPVFFIAYLVGIFLIPTESEVRKRALGQNAFA